MGISIQIVDEYFGKSKTPVFEISFPAETITIRDLITRRVEDEVAQVNAQKFLQKKTLQERMFLAGITNRAPETLLNADTPKRHKMIDPVLAVNTALKAFEAGRYFVLINDTQIETLDEAIIITPETEAVFLRLTPLVGG